MIKREGIRMEFIFWLFSAYFFCSIAGDPGVVFILQGKHLYHEKVPDDAPHQYYGTLEGPSWENNYCTWRTYIDQDNRNCIDLTGKKKYSPTLKNYDAPNADVHADNPWGTDNI